VYAPGASFLFTAPALTAALGAVVALLVRRPVWSVVALAAGLVAGSALLPYFAFMVFGAMGLSLAGIGAVFTVLYAVLLLPVAELLVPEAARARVTVAVPATALLASAALVAAGLAIDRPDAEHPAPTHLAYVLNADTGQASWVSADPSPGEWTSEHVDSQNTDALPPGYQRGTLWTGEAPAIDATGPEVTAVRRAGTTVTFRVRSTRGASSVVLRLNAPITGVTARIGDHPEVSTAVTGTRKNTWPGEIRLRDLPAEGATITVTTKGGNLRVTAIDETLGLPETTPRPDTTTPSTREDGGVTAVARTYDL
jgi:hypothetical protein